MALHTHIFRINHLCATFLIQAHLVHNVLPYLRRHILQHTLHVLTPTYFKPLLHLPSFRSHTNVLHLAQYKLIFQNITL